jgi:potassium-dependent mechanosensitive channel
MLERFQALMSIPLFDLGGGTLTLSSVVVGLLVLGAFRVLAEVLGRMVARGLAARGVDPGTQFALQKIIRYVLFVIGALVALNTVGIQLDAVFAAGAVLAVGIGFGLQNIVQNFVAGLILLIERPIAVGNFVKIGDAFGSVVDVGMRATRVITRDGVTIIVPNSELVSAQVVNYSVPTPVRRVKVTVGVAYGSDPEAVRAALLASCARVPGVLEVPSPEVWFEDFGGSSLDFAVLAWIGVPRDDLRVSSQLRFAICEELARAGLSIPFPQLDLHVRSAVPPIRVSEIAPDTASEP